MAIKEYLFSNNKIQFKKCKIKNINNTIYNNKEGYYKIEIYGAKSRNVLYNHFDKYPLLGDKLLSYLN
jgi:LAGLIDADG endonuclease